jgi:hypothetical protein
VSLCVKTKRILEIRPSGDPLLKPRNMNFTKLKIPKGNTKVQAK